MSSAPLEVQIIYSASSKGRRRRGRVFRTRSVGGRGLLVLGLLNLAAACGLYYWTWWVQDKEIYLMLMLHTPVVGVDANVSSGLVPPKRVGRRSPTAAVEKSPDARPRLQGGTARNVLGITAYAWLTLATIASSLLAFSSGASFGRVGGSSLRVLGGIAALVAIAGLGWAGYRVWAEYGGGYPVSYLRFGMGGIILTALFIGVGLLGRPRRWTLLASLALILTGVGSSVALYLGEMCGAVEPEQTTPMFLGMVFGIHSIWGWILLPIAWRMPRA